MDNKATGYTQLQGHIDIIYIIYKYIYKSMHLYYYIFSVIVQNTLIWVWTIQTSGLKM